MFSICSMCDTKFDSAAISPIISFGLPAISVGWTILVNSVQGEPINYALNNPFKNYSVYNAPKICVD